MNTQNVRETFLLKSVLHDPTGFGRVDFEQNILASLHYGPGQTNGHFTIPSAYIEHVDFVVLEFVWFESTGQQQLTELALRQDEHGAAAQDAVDVGLGEEETQEQATNDVVNLHPKEI